MRAIRFAPLPMRLLVAAAVAAFAPPARAATIEIINANSAGVGFNDPTPVSPVGGNNGTTLGAQRLRVFQEAAAIWGALLPSDVTIRVRATFEALSCNSQGAVLGSAGPATASLDFTGAPFAHTWYHAALANRVAGRDLAAGSDDIIARFNSDVDGTCLGSSDWYYGFDHDERTDQDLLAVVTHEIGHGLGFSTLVDVSTGAQFDDHPDIFSRFLFDNATNKHWSEMTNAERAASAIHTGGLVWSGTAVTNEAPNVLVVQAPPQVIVNSPAAIAGELQIALADFGAPLSNPGVTANVVLANPVLACSPLTNAAQMAGKIALIDRGTCSFVEKARAAQAAGAVGALVANNESGLQPMSGSAPDVVIPVIGITQSAGTAIKNRLGSGAVNVTIGLGSARLAGADPQGRVLLYAPEPLEVGSSVSHWDVSATPNLLMEPFISSDLTSDVDLTLESFMDLGWLAGGGGGGPGGGGTTPSLPPLVALSAGPNPFVTRDATHVTLSFVLDRAATIDVYVTDLRGRLVKRLFTGYLGAGEQAPIRWDGTDEDGRVMDSGVYYARVHSGDDGATKKFALIR
jgi:hypothetical protein